MIKFPFLKNSKSTIKKIDNVNDLTIEERIIQIKNGHEILRNDFISEFTPFILSTVSRSIGKYVDLQNSDEYSIGLIAFNEAIDRFDASKKCSFLTFAEKVIKSRVIDFMRKNRKHKENTYSINSLYNENLNDSNDLKNEELLVCDNTVNKFENIEVQEELLFIHKMLEEYGIGLGSLPSCSPKHRKTRKLCIEIAKTILENNNFLLKLKTNKRLPKNELIRTLGVNHKTIEKFRNYIIAVVIILDSNLEEIKNYFNNI